MNKSRNDLRKRSEVKERRSSKHSRNRDRSSSSSSRSSSSSGSRKSKHGSRSRSIIGRLKGDLAECDNLQLIKFSNIVKEKNNLDATNREFASLVKDLKKKLEEEQEKNQQLITQQKLHEVQTKRIVEDSVNQGTLIKEQEETIRVLKANLSAEKELLVEKKKKWKGRINDLMVEIEKMKESNITLDNKVNNYEQLTVNQDALLTEEKDKIMTIENNLALMQVELDKSRKEAVAHQEKIQTQETELAELTVRFQYETRAAMELKTTIDELKAVILEKEKTLEETKKENKKKREKMVVTKDAEISKLTQENSELKSLLSKAEGRVLELETNLDDLKDKFDDTLRQLNIAEVKLTDLVKEKELVLELKTCLGEKDREIDQKREYINVRSFYQKLEKEILIVQNHLDSKQQEISRLNLVIGDHKDAFNKKETELFRILGEKDDLLRKAGELEGKVIELDQIQRNDIEGLENRVESTILELRSAKEDNANLLIALSKAETALTEADSKFVTFRDKYYSKKTEANVLRDKVDKLIAEISRLKSENSRYNEALDNKRVQVAMNENKNKVGSVLFRLIET